MVLALYVERRVDSLGHAVRRANGLERAAAAKAAVSAITGPRLYEFVLNHL